MRIKALFLTALLLATSPALGVSFHEPAARAHWECVPYARELSGIQIYGDAHTWWDQAEGRYARGSRPRVGAVLSFIPHGGMLLGHVATVTGIIDERTIRVTHANWSPINGERGQVEHDVEVLDVSEAGDWSAVRVWFAPSEGLGSTAWPTNGFIYPVAAASRSVATSTTVSILKPTGRLNYLGKMLQHLK
jgi:surface antigen